VMGDRQTVAAVLLAVLVLALALWGAWRGMQSVPPRTARLWALVATLALPVAIAFGWWAGHTEARGRLEGIDQALDKAMGAAAQVAGLGLRTQRARDNPPVDGGWEVLPDVEIVERPQLTDQEAIEL